MFELAVRIAAKWHTGQKRWGGEPYLIHPMRVALKFVPDEVMMSAGVLHDTVEDTEVTLMDIKSLFGGEVESLVCALTRPEGESYDDFIERVVLNPRAAQIKIADIEDNMNDDGGDIEKKKSMNKRYSKALKRLRESL